MAIEILDFDTFRNTLLLEQEDPTAAPPPASPVTDVPPPPPTPNTPSTPPGTNVSLPPDPNAAPPIPEEPKGSKFVFIQDAPEKKWHGQFDKNGGVKRFTVYEVMPEDLEKWLTTHKDDSDADQVNAALSGKRPMSSSIYSDFKREVTDGTLGSDKGPIDITFDSDTDFDNPSTTDLDVVFLRSKK